MKLIKYLLFCWLSLTSFSSIAAESPVKVTVVAEEESIQPGQPFWVAISLQIEEGWHLFWKNPGDSGLPISVDWNLPEEIKVHSLEWISPQRLDLDGLVGFGYEDQAILLAQLMPSESLNIDKKISIAPTISWLACSDIRCQPETQSAEIFLPVLGSNPTTNLNSTPIFAEARQKLPQLQDVTVSYHENHDIHIEIPSTSLSSIKKIEFFPEHPKVIDSTKNPEYDTNEKGYCIHLKAESNIQNNQVKGVLVLHTNDDIPTAVQVTANLDSSEIALLDMPVAAHAAAHHSNFNDGILWALFFAFLGGACLNLMPCVLPVLSFKVMNFVKMSQQNRWVSLKHGLLFSLGILLSFWILAGTILGLQFYGESVGWGFQLQEPLFVAGLAILLFVFALSLFGIFEIGLGLASFAGEAQPHSKSENANSFLSGVLATVVATPCTGPFLGSVIGLAVTLPVFYAILIFTFVALGLSAPYLLLAGFPPLLRFIPKPGPWMETFKQFLGFLLIATVLWLLWVFNAQTNFLAFFSLLISFFFFAIAAWIYGHWATPISTKRSRICAYLFIVLCLGIGITLIALPRSTWKEGTLVAQAKGDWETFSPERVAELQKQGIPVFVDFTAKWCLICQANHFILTTDQIEEKFNEAGVVKMKADWTKNDPVITQELAKFGRNSVPLYLLYGNQGAEPEILPQVLTPEVVLNSLDNAVERKVE